MKAISVCSILHEPAGEATHRIFRGEPVLAMTLRRLQQCHELAARVILGWDDQEASLTFANGIVHGCGARRSLPSLEAITAAQRWADGWRGGLLGTAWFDRGFVAAFVRDAMIEAEADAVVVVDAAAGLVDPAIISQLIATAQGGDRDFYFTAAAPGLGGALLRRALVERLVAGNAAPGRLVHYLPDAPILDPITSDACIELPLPLTRSLDRFLFDSDRILRRAQEATLPLNGTLMTTRAETLVQRMGRLPRAEETPREITVEITARRNTRPVFLPGTHLDICRPDIPLEMVGRLLDGISGIDDLRITLAGAGDPLLHPEIGQILEMLKDVPAVALETDLVGVSDEALAAVVRTGVDVVGVHLPALSAAVYEQTMGAAELTAAVESIKRLLMIRQQAGRGTPIVAPLFTKMAANLDEMEQWYDTWLRAIQSAVILGPSDYAGQLPNLAAADMSPPLRRPCRRLERRMTILSSGDIVGCEQDALGVSPLGNVARDDLLTVWREQFAVLRAAHQEGGLSLPVLCTGCKEWDRP